MTAAQPSFSIPKEYADFVSSSTDLLEQFREGAQESDEVVYRVYLDTLTDHVDDVSRQYELLSKLKETIDRLVEPDVSSYHWHRERFRLEIAYPVVGVHTHTHSKTHRHTEEESEASSLLYLKGVTRYGESLEDEWFIVFLLQRITRTLPHLCAQVSDADGEFLLIEAAEHIHDWLGPENARNRVWIRGGRVHVIPRETAGARRDGGMRLLPALRALREENNSSSPSPSSSSLASSGVQNAIAVRTTRAFPARARALQHSVACIVPQWVAHALSADPSLVSAAVHAFSNSEVATLSAALSAIDLHALAATSAKAIAFTAEEQSSASANNNTQSRDALKAVRVAMTRTLFAQLTFKQFTKIPRKYHAYVRRMAAFTSARVSLALNIGLRITAGLELAWAERVRERERFALLRQESQCAVESALREKFFLEEQAVLSLSRVLLADVVDSQRINNNNNNTDNYDDRADWSLLFAEKDRLSLCEVLAHSFGNDSSHATTEEEDNFITANDAQAAKEITTNVVAGDSEDWLHLSPEQLDAEIESRTKQFASLSPSGDESSSDVGATTTDPVAEKEQPSSLSGVGNDEGEVERLQKIVNDFKLFLNEKSDFDGISRTKKREKNSTQQQQQQRQVKSFENKDVTINDDFVSAELDTSSFDVAYLESVLATFDLRLDGSVIEKETKRTDKAEEERPEPARELIAGVAQKFISTNNETRTVDDEDSIDSDDEIDEEQQESCEKPTHVTVDDDEDEDDDDSDEESEDDADSDWDSDENSEGEERPHHFSEENDRDDDEDDDEDKEYSMEELQRLMDSQLFDEKALANTFAHLFENADAQELADFDDMDLDANFLMSMMEAHAEGLGVPSGPINQILGQLGLSLPRPPPMNEAPKKNKTKK